MKKFSRRNSLLVTLPLVALAAAYFWFMFLPAKRAVAAMRLDLEQKHTYLASASTTLAKIKQVQQERAKTQEYIKRWRGISASSAETAMLFGQIASTIEGSGVVTTQFTPEPPTRYEQVTRVPVRIDFEGTFSQACAVLESLEKLSERVWINDVNFETDGKDGGLLRCEVSLAVFANNSGKND